MESKTLIFLARIHPKFSRSQLLAVQALFPVALTGKWADSLSRESDGIREANDMRYRPPYLLYQLANTVQDNLAYVIDFLAPERLPNWRHCFYNIFWKAIAQHMERRPFFWVFSSPYRARKIRSGAEN